MFKKNILLLVLIFSPMLIWAQIPESPEDWTRYFNASFLPVEEAKEYETPQIENFNEVASKQRSRNDQPSQSSQAMGESIAPSTADVTAELEITPVEIIYQLPDEIRKEEVAAPSSALKEHYQLYQAQYPINKLVFEYARSALMSVRTDGWLVVNGHLDTYPLRALQSNSGFRTDVQVVNLQWLRSSSDYRAFIATKLGIQEFRQAPLIEMIRMLQVNLGERLHLSMTLSTEVLGAMLDEISPRGLVFSLNRNVDHSSKHHEVMKSVNWQSVTDGSAPEYIKGLNQNYLAALLIHKKMQLPDNIGGYSREWIIERLYQQRPVESTAKKYLKNE